MASIEAQLAPELARLESLLAQMSDGAPRDEVVDRIRAHASALNYHLRRREDQPVIAAIIGGTGTGKSTLLNRLMGREISATSFRRTFTAGAVAVVGAAQALPANWLGVEHVPVEALPAQGRIDALLVAAVDRPLSDSLILVDTPDLDGDQPRHHAQADRAFRWIDAAIFLVTPEKYQMTELLPYYALAARYRIEALFVMNKCEESAALEDFARQLTERGHAQPRLFAVRRDDSTFQPPADANLEALRGALATLSAQPPEARRRGLAMRAADLAGRLRDQLVSPLRDQRRQSNRLIEALRAIVAPEPGVDVSPVTRALQHRMREQSVLYLIGPGRLIDRARQVPALLAHLPRATWGMIFGRDKAGTFPPAAEPPPTDAPDFRTSLVNEFTNLQSRIDDALRCGTGAPEWLNDDAARASFRIPPEEAGRIADEELADLKQWLTDRWNATPRDTAILRKFMRYLPGANKLTKYSEAAPWLLTLTVLSHGAVFGYLDQMILGGWTLATWVSERLSNEVISRTRQANRRIAERYTALAHRQIDTAIEWIDRRAPSLETLAALDSTADALALAAKPWMERP